MKTVRTFVQQCKPSSHEVQPQAGVQQHIRILQEASTVQRREKPRKKKGFKQTTFVKRAISFCFLILTAFFMGKASEFLHLDSLSRVLSFFSGTRARERKSETKKKFWRRYEKSASWTMQVDDVWHTN